MTNLGFYFRPLRDISDLKLPTRIKEIWGFGLGAFHRQLPKWLEGFHPPMKGKMDLCSNSLFSPLWMLHKSTWFSLAWISHKSTCNRKFEVEAGTSVRNSCCQGGRIGGKDLKGIFWVSGKNWSEVSASHPQPYPTRTTSLLQTNMLQRSLSMGCIHKCQPLKARSAERQGFRSLSITSCASFPPLSFASMPALKIFLLYKLLTLE